MVCKITNITIEGGWPSSQLTSISFTHLLFISLHFFLSLSFFFSLSFLCFHFFPYFSSTALARTLILKINRYLKYVSVPFYFQYFSNMFKKKTSTSVSSSPVNPISLPFACFYIGSLLSFCWLFPVSVRLCSKITASWQDCWACKKRPL